MTENTAIKEIVRQTCEGCYGLDDSEVGMCKKCGYQMAIKALEEIQQYRAIGTVEEIQKAMENLPLHQVEHKLLQEYQAICTVRECKIAVERMKSKKPDYEADGYADGQLVYDYAKCPICGHDFEYGINDWECKYCSDCGQKLDWK